MDKHLFAKIILISKVVELISKEYSLSLDEARNLFYKSKTIKLLNNNNTHLYSQSPLYNFSLFEEEYNKKRS